MSGSDSDDEPDDDKKIKISMNVNMKFNGPDVEKKERLALVDSEEYWRWVEGGFNYGGRCMNLDCISHRKGNGFVVWNRGYGSIRPNEDVSYGSVRCRGCENKFQPTEFTISEAVGSLYYTLFAESVVNTVKIRSIGKNQSLVFGENVCPKWYSLMVFVLKPDFTAVHITSDDSEAPKKVVWSRKVYDKHGISEMRNPANIRFSQDFIRPKFGCGRLLAHTHRELEKGEIDVWDIPPISIFKMDGNWYTSDNRRLWVFKRIGKDNPRYRIPVKIIEKYKVNKSKITTRNRGKYVRVRRFVEDEF